jgi:hypothetical protein
MCEEGVPAMSSSDEGRKRVNVSYCGAVAIVILSAGVAKYCGSGGQSIGQGQIQSHAQHRQEQERLGALVRQLEGDGRGVWPEDFNTGANAEESFQEASAFDKIIESLAQSPESNGRVGWMDSINALAEMPSNGTGLPPRADVREVLAFPRNGTLTEWVEAREIICRSMDPVYRAARNVADVIAMGAGTDTEVRAIETLCRYVDGAPATSIVSYLSGMGVHMERARAYLSLARGGQLESERVLAFLGEQEDAILDGFANAIRAERLLSGGRMARSVDTEGGAPEAGAISVVSSSDALTFLQLMLDNEEAVRARVRWMSEAEYSKRLRGAGDVLSRLGLWGSPRMEFTPYQYRMRCRLAKTALRVLLLRDRNGRLASDHEELRRWLGKDAQCLDSDAISPRTIYVQGDGHISIVADPGSRPTVMGPRVQVVVDVESPVYIGPEEVRIRVE